MELYAILRRGGLSGMEQQHAEERPFMLAPEFDLATVDGRFEPSENPASHVRHRKREDRRGAEACKHSLRGCRRSPGQP